MHSDQDILDYLESLQGKDSLLTSDLFTEIKNCRERIEIFSKAELPSAKRLNLLNKHRLLSSNTLSKGREENDLHSWNKAQAKLFEFLQKQKALTLDNLITLNSVILDNPSSKVRTFEIETGSGEYLSSSKVSEALELYFKTLKSFTNDPIRQAFETYLYIVTIHPFENGNGRTARLAADFYLFANNYLPVYFKSSIKSHAALVKNNIQRSKDKSFLNFLEALLNSYQIVYQP